MLTRRGWGLAIGGVALVAAGRALGIYELFVLAAGGIGLLLAGAIRVVSRRTELVASRQLRPTRLHAGADSRVELAVRNTGRRPSPVVTIRDSLAPSGGSPSGGSVPRVPPEKRRRPPADFLPFPGRGLRAAGAGEGRREARFLLAPVGPGAEERATYRLPADRRGRYRLGPLVAQASDHLGLWSAVVDIAPSVELTVYPATEPVVPLSRTRGDDPTAGGPRRAGVGPQGDDFYGLRPYQRGDDLRRVHWPSTARADELMVRQVELPWEGRATVLLDVRGKVHTAASLETAVSATASILVASRRAGALVRLATTNGTDSGFTTGHAHFEAVMEHLAVIEAGDEPSGEQGSLELVVAGLRRAGNGGALAVVTTAAAAAGDLETVAGLYARFDSLTLLVLDRADRAGAGRAAPATRLAREVTVVGVERGRSFAAAWNQALGGAVPAAIGGLWS